MNTNDQQSLNESINQMMNGQHQSVQEGYTAPPIDMTPFDVNPLDWDRHGTDPKHPNYELNKRLQYNDTWMQWNQWLKDGWISQEQYNQQYPNG